MSNAILANKKVTMQISVTKSQKTSGGLGNLYVNDLQENGKRIKTNTLFWVSRYLQRLD